MCLLELIFFILDDLLVMVNDDLSSNLVVDGILYELLIYLLLSLVLHNLLHLFQGVWELIQDVLKGFPVVFQG